MSKLREARELLQGGDRLTAGEYSIREGCYCSVGALVAVHGAQFSTDSMPAYREDVRRLADAVRASDGLAPSNWDHPESPIWTITDWNDAQFEAGGWDSDHDPAPTSPAAYLAAKESILAVWDAAIAELEAEEAKQ